jgi:Helicase associated domain
VGPIICSFPSQTRSLSQVHILGEGMVRFVTYPHPPMETTEMEEWERRYREVVGCIVAFGNMSALERRRPSIMPEDRRGQGGSKREHDEDDFDVDHDVGLEPLREWVQEQRRLYYHGMLPEYRVSLLNQIRFRWSENHSLHRGGDDLIRGHQNPDQRALLDCPSVVTVPPDASGHDELVETSTWDTTESEVGAVDPDSESATATAAVAAPWGGGATPQDLAWEERYRALCEYKTAHGNCRVPRRYKDDRSLGLWVGNQRMSLKKGTMRPDRKKRLDAIGFETVDARYSWSVERNTARLERAWLDMYEALLKYHARSGSTDVPKSYVCTVAGRQIALGRWVSRQRTNFAKGIIREDRRQMLDEIGFSWCTPTTVVLKDHDLEPLDFRKAAPAASANDADEDSVSCGSLLSFRKQPGDHLAHLRHDDDGSASTAGHPPAFVVVSPNPPRHTNLIRTDPRNFAPPVFAAAGGVDRQTAGSDGPSIAQLEPTDRRRQAAVACLSFESQQSMISPQNNTPPNEYHHGESHRRTSPFPSMYTN